MANLYSLPWENKNDIQLHANEFVQLSTINRGLRRLLENDRWMLKYNIVATPDKVARHTRLVSSGKALQIDVTGGATYFLPLYTE